MKKYLVKNAFYLNGIVQGAGSIVELDGDEFERLSGKDVIGKEVVETAAPTIISLGLDAFEALNASEQKAELSRLGIEGDDNNKELRVALFAAHLEGGANVKTEAGDTASSGTGDAGSDQGTTEI